MKTLLKHSKKLAVSAVALVVISGAAMQPAEARRYYDDYYYGNQYGSYFDRHPYVKKAAIGGGIGAVAGALLSSEGSRGSGAIKGGLVGAAAGLGYEYLRQRGTFNRGYNNRYW